MTNPTHTYSQAGVYDVCLTTSSYTVVCSDTKCKRVIAGNPDHACIAKISSIRPEEILDPENIPVNFIGKILSTEPACYFNNYWDLGDSVLIQNETNFIHNYQSTGLFLVQYSIFSNGCSDHVFELINLDSPNNFNVMFGVIPVEDGTKDVSKKPIKFKGVTTGEPSLFNWDFGDGEVDTTSLFPTHEFFPNITHNVCLTVSNPKIGETDTYCMNILIVDNTQNIATIDNDISVNIYPNPANDYINIDYTLCQSSNIDISLFDAKGIKHKEIISDFREKGENYQTLFVGDLASGIYFIKCITNNSIVISNIIVQ